jgi:hypothetical protein
MLGPITRLIEVAAELAALCFFVTLGVYLYYDGNPPPKIERLLDRAMNVFERGADSLFSRLRSKERTVIDVTPERPKKLPPTKLIG